MSARTDVGAAKRKQHITKFAIEIDAYAVTLINLL
jgi:hypothetical protein